MSIRVGISGWVYPPWRGVFYPDDLTIKKELQYASRQVSTIEINGSFYSNQRPETYTRWYKETPDDFCFSVKGSRFITHILRLKNCERALENFFGSGVLNLQQKLGVFLWQIPPNLVFDPEVIEKFFQLLPKTFAEATKMADRSERYDKHYSDRIRRSKQKLRHCLEVRHHSFENPEFIALLRKYNIALVFADTAGKWPYMEDVTADFVYVRLHGDEEFYVSGYSPESLRWWAARIDKWTKGKQPADALTITEEKIKALPRDVYIYFDNDLKVKAPFDAKSLIQML
ncbi:DUF72 domain-containing protein [Bdellovibrio sp. SKB1291214]|uniref:DUF72 domain-containing protein n=1 Tax=Bdellovibrio sp. SKB1291214 TaxID=1732569 RepID=UPI000B51D039|nr:DUF72 domain-containing protein [Bdellovibrio sp. SKB1291214]UYL09934.1 DUF72 domain-containing protein [Bdellovibrio sp. SKB1291214]